ncbi:MAG TPA: hypothetical protein VHW65_10295 [Gemmatimonadales bacterium]|nr:hypothetical protein [Gemmatimonadales bacterium]
MLWRAVRLLLRIAGWLLTPLVVTVAAAIGATIGLVVAPHFTPYAALGVTLGLGFLGAVAGLLAWATLLRDNPELQHVLAVTPAGVPTADAVDQLMHPSHVPPPPDHDEGPAR